MKTNRGFNRQFVDPTVAWQLVRSKNAAGRTSPQSSKALHGPKTGPAAIDQSPAQARGHFRS